MRACAGIGIVLGAGLPLPAVANPVELAVAALTVCVAEEDALSACAGTAVAACLADEAAFAHAPNDTLRHEWCLRAEMAALVQMEPEVTADTEICPAPDVAADDADHLVEAECLRDAQVAALAEAGL